jgi:hypothetical protein
MPLKYTEISNKRVSRGTNVNAATIPANRVVGFGTSSTHGDPIDILSVAGAAKIKGVTDHAIAPGETGDIFVEGVVPIESDGSGVIAAGDDVTPNLVAGANEGQVKKAAPASGVNASSAARPSPARPRSPARS